MLDGSLKAAVYPRVCGGTLPLNNAMYLVGGLSPRVRGNHQAGLSDTRYARSIPACAGEPALRRARGHLVRVYPRVCGGTTMTSRAMAISRGLSPRVRGNRLNLGLPPLAGWSIPACAGEPGRRRPRRQSEEVYPRVCGGTSGLRSAQQARQGLSPRVRGNPFVGADEEASSGSIPACAGEPSARRRIPSRTPVYPRVCGGTSSGRQRAGQARGLSPRVRGNHSSLMCPPVRGGSIPACAGEPARVSAPARSLSVYPRVCGGTLTRYCAQVAACGLSPRVRGNPSEANPQARPGGSIPACAGEPSAPPAEQAFARVYPRVCGGTALLVSGQWQ